MRRIDSTARMSQGVVVDGMLHTAGQVANDKFEAVEGQTRQVLEKIEKLMALAGGNKQTLVSVTVYLAAITDFHAMNSVYDAWIDPGHPPVRTCVEARLANSGIKVEISAICKVAT